MLGYFIIEPCLWLQWRGGFNLKFIVGLCIWDFSFQIILGLIGISLLTRQSKLSLQLLLHQIVGRLKIAKLSPRIVGIHWTHSGRPFHGVSLAENNVHLAIGVIMELLPCFVDSFVLELDSFFLKMANSPFESDWNQRFISMSYPQHTA